MRVEVNTMLVDLPGTIKAFVAKDCAPHIFKEITDNCNKYGIYVEYIESMSELGKICGIDVGAAVAVITK